MTSERWETIKTVFAAALECEAESRIEFLERACSGDAELRDEVASLLEAYEEDDAFLSDPFVCPSWARVCPTCGARYEGSQMICAADGDVLVDDPTSLLGTNLDGLYHIERLLGRGGFGTVYLARHALLDDLVAIKVLHREVTANPELLRRFLREGRAARSIQHPNVVTIHDLRTTDDGVAYLVMEYVEGRTLKDETSRVGTLSAAETVRLLTPVAAALDCAHARGIVHRDVKPANVMITGAGADRSAKLLDLGLAKLREFADAAGGGAPTLTAPGQYMGSPSYMSPEQWGAAQSDGTEEIDGRSDVYSLAAIAFEMVTGRRAFEGERLSDLRRAHTTGARPLAYDVNAAVPVGFATAIARSLSIDRGERHESAGALLTALARALESDEEPTLREIPVERERQPRSRWLLLAIAAVVVLVVSGAVWSWVSDSRDASPLEASPVTSAPASVGVGTAYLDLTEAERVAFVDERARAISFALSGREYTFPPDVRMRIKRFVDDYADRVGNGRTEPPKEDLTRVLARGREYAPYFNAVFRDAGLPGLMGVYIPMIESEFISDAVSPAGAVGAFQIMPKTGERYGATPEDLLVVDRAAPVAARFLKQRMSEFGDDSMREALSIAAYNRGPKGIQEYLDEVIVLDDAEAEARFWAMLANSNSEQMPNAENTIYVARFFAAAIVGENPASFGLDTPPLSSGTSGSAGK